MGCVASTFFLSQSAFAGVSVGKCASLDSGYLGIYVNIGGDKLPFVTFFESTLFSYRKRAFAKMSVMKTSISVTHYGCDLRILIATRRNRCVKNS